MCLDPCWESDGFQIETWGLAVMKNRGRPNEQAKGETAEGRVWAVIHRLKAKDDFGRTVRDIARLSGYSIGAVAKTLAWRGYNRERQSRNKQPRDRSLVKAAPKRRPAESVEGRVFQIIREAGSRDDFSLTVRGVAELIGRSRSAVQKTEAWRGYIRARETEKETSANRRRGHGIR